MRNVGHATSRVSSRILRVLGVIGRQGLVRRQVLLAEVCRGLACRVEFALLLGARDI